MTVYLAHPRRPRGYRGTHRYHCAAGFRHATTPTADQGASTRVERISRQRTVTGER